MKFIKDMISRRPSQIVNGDGMDIQRETLQQDLEDSGFGGSVLKRAEMHSQDPFVKKAMQSEEAAIAAGVEEDDPVTDFQEDDVASFDEERDAYGETLRAGLEHDLAGEVEDEEEPSETEAEVAYEDGPEASDENEDEDDYQDDDIYATDDDFEDDYESEFEDDEDVEVPAAEKEALLAEIRDAMGAMSHIKPEDDGASETDAGHSRHGSWAEDEEFGRQALARAHLDQLDENQVGDRILEETNSKFSDDEGSRRRLAIAHMKAAAAATKADRVLKRHTGRDPSNDPEEQHQYRQDLAKVMRPHEPELEVEETAMDTPRRSPDHASHRVVEDPEMSADWREVTEEENINSIQSDVGGPIADDQPTPEPEAEPAIEDQTASSERPISEGRRRIWDMEDESDEKPVTEPLNAFAEPETAFESTPELAADSEPEPEEAGPAPATARVVSQRRPGRVKTRIIGFQPTESEDKDLFNGAAKQESHSSKFPAGWIVVTSGPGRGAAFTLLNGVSKIGRGDGQAVMLDFGDNSISRDNHAAIAFDGETRKFFLGHGGKSNIVRLNDKPVLSTEELMDGDSIRIGETTLTFVAFCGEDFSWDDEGEGGSEHAAIA